jgi:TrmH family RNA methyltransferase
MPIRNIQSKDNTRIKELRKALADPGRSPGSLVGGASGLVGIEGPNLIEESLRAGLSVRTIFVAQGAERLLAALRIPPEIELLQLPRKLLDSALATESPQPIAALVEPPQWTWEHVLGLRRKSAPLVVVLAGLQDPGNLGTILRSAEAFGASGVVSLPGTVSAWNPKAVRASAGSVFRVPLLAAGEAEAFARLREAGAKILAAASRGATALTGVDLQVPVALVIGNEGNGVPDAIARAADGEISIPCPGPVESLNAAIAASVLLYEASRQRATRMNEPSSSPRLSSKAPNRAAGARR